MDLLRSRRSRPQKASDETEHSSSTNSTNNRHHNDNAANTGPPPVTDLPTRATLTTTNTTVITSQPALRVPRRPTGNPAALKLQTQGRHSSTIQHNNCSMAPPRPRPVTATGTRCVSALGMTDAAKHNSNTSVGGGGAFGSTMTKTQNHDHAYVMRPPSAGAFQANPRAPSRRVDDGDDEKQAPPHPNINTAAEAIDSSLHIEEATLYVSSMQQHPLYGPRQTNSPPRPPENAPRRPIRFTRQPSINSANGFQRLDSGQSVVSTSNRSVVSTKSYASRRSYQSANTSVASYTSSLAELQQYTSASGWALQHSHLNTGGRPSLPVIRAGSDRSATGPGSSNRFQALYSRPSDPIADGFIQRFNDGASITGASIATQSVGSS